jgi:hypothetical protein
VWFDAGDLARRRELRFADEMPHAPMPTDPLPAATTSMLVTRDEFDIESAGRVAGLWRWGAIPTAHRYSRVASAH